MLWESLDHRTSLAIHSRKISQPDALGVITMELLGSHVITMELPEAQHPQSQTAKALCLEGVGWWMVEFKGLTRRDP